MVIVRIAVLMANDEVFGDGAVVFFPDDTVEGLSLAREICAVLTVMVCDAIVLDHGAGAAQESAAFRGTGDHASALYAAAGRGEGAPAVGAGARDLTRLHVAGPAAIDGTLASDRGATGGAWWAGE